MLFAFLGLLWDIAAITFPAWGASIGILVLVFYIFRYEKVLSFGSSGELESVISLTRSGEGFQYKAGDESSVEPYVSVFAAYLVSIPLATLAFFMILAHLKTSGALDGLTFNILGGQEPVSSQGGKVLSFIPALLFGFLAIYIIRPRKSLRNALKNRADSIATNANQEMNRLNELFSLGASMQAMGNDFHIAYPVDFKTEMMAFVGSHAKEILSSSSEFHNLIEEKLEEARGEYAKLSKARDLYVSVQKYYEETGRIVNRTRARNMIRELGTYDEGLQSDNLKAYIIQKQWDDFYTVMDMMKENLEELNEIASNYQSEMYDESEELQTPAESEEEKAYKIFGLPPTATNDQIKKARNLFGKAWHHDHNPGLDDTRMKDINWAYDILKKKRKIK